MSRDIIRAALRREISPSAGENARVRDDAESCKNKVPLATALFAIADQYVSPG
jgi:hypothetical protein